MRYFRNVLHGLWTGATAGILSGGLLGMAFILAVIISEGGATTQELLEGIPFIMIYGGLIFGLPTGLFAGGISGLLLSTLFKPQQAPSLGLMLGGLVGATFSLFFLGSLLMEGPLSWFGLILAAPLGFAIGGFGGRVGGQLFWKYAALTTRAFAL